MSANIGDRLRFRKTRTTLSAVCLVACLLMICLWVRSYWWFDVVQFCPTTRTVLRATSQEGAISFMRAGPVLGNVNVPTIHFRAEWYEDYDVQNAFALSKAFRWFARPNPYLLIVPDWFFVLTFAVLAIAPWSRRWNSRFTLRTLFVVITLAAGALGLLVYLLRME
jgi:hypothetical protein